MASSTVELPGGVQLEQEIFAIEVEEHDAVVSATIAKRVKIADVNAAPLQRHEDVFAASKTRLMERMAGKVDE